MFVAEVAKTSVAVRNSLKSWRLQLRRILRFLKNSQPLTSALRPLTPYAAATCPPRLNSAKSSNQHSSSVAWLALLSTWD
jgi:hypothetical protein